ncbi:glycosyltransferase [Campylobacter sp.]|uniref:glycosyltransferase n=1 Tax=Campylobacter sp. TaxID=205 RepID=UPI0026DB217A|nr:glycosyltransferase [Campylobacter sp.]MDO4674673.1 glycosyltransferase [Campylobacter sp.]
MHKILLITPELEYTGALNSFKRMCQTLLNNGFAVGVWSYEFGPFIEELDGLGIITECIGEDELCKEWVARRIFAYNLVIANTVVVYKAVELIADLVPVMWYVREAENLPSFFWKAQRKTALERAKKLFVVSEYARDFIVKNYNPSVEVLHNYVDDVFATYGYKIDQKDPKERAKLRFLALGTIEERKGYDVLIEAFLALPGHIRSQCELHFAGRLWEGARDFYPKIFKQIKKHANIFYHGELRDKKRIYKLLAQSDVVVVPSRDESCSLVALEGAMMARVLILSENIGAKYLLNEGNGLSVKTGCAHALRCAFEALFARRKELSLMGERAREAYLSSSTYEIYEKNFIAIVRKELAPNPYLHRVRQKPYALYSFDIFDTLMMRKVAEPRAIFTLMRERICHWDLPRHLVENFEYLRIESEQYFYRNVCKNDFLDVRFEEIYDLLARNFSLSQEQKARLMQTEIELESENLVPIPCNIKLVEELFKEGKELVLISDMYFDATILRRFLLNFSPIFEHIFIYSSSDYRKKKNNGALFKKILRERKIQANCWLHFGDNFAVDCLEAKKLGIDFHYYQNELLPYEEYALKHSGGDIFIQRYIAQARIFRKHNVLSSLEELGASFGAALLFPYVHYVLEEALRGGVELLYFVARDGYLLQKISDKIIKKEGLNLQTRYIHGSREAWKKPFESKDFEQISLLRAYLKQELSQKKFAFVELSGTGKTLDCIVRLIKEDKALAPYFLDSFYLFKSDFSSCGRFFAPSIFESRYFLEFFARSLEGQTLAYKKVDESIHPVFNDLEAQALKNFGYGAYIDGLLRFVDFLLENDHKPYTPLSHLYFQYLSHSEIDKNFVELIGNLPFSLDTTYVEGSVVARRFYELKEVRESKSSQFAWSILRSSPQVRSSYGQCRKLCPGAVARVKSHLSYKLGNLLITHIKHPLGIIKLLFLIPALVLAHGQDLRIRRGEMSFALEYYDDYEEALSVQNFFSYQLGKLCLASAKKYLLLAPLILPFQIFILHKKRIGKRK